MLFHYLLPCCTMVVIKWISKTEVDCLIWHNFVCTCNLNHILNQDQYMYQLIGNGSVCRSLQSKIALHLTHSRHYITDIIQHIGRPCLKNMHFNIIKINQSKCEYIHVRLPWRRVTRWMHTPRNISTWGYPGDDDTIRYIYFKLNHQIIIYSIYKYYNISSHS